MKINWDNIMTTAGEFYTTSNGVSETSKACKMFKTRFRNFLDLTDSSGKKIFPTVRDFLFCNEDQIIKNLKSYGDVIKDAVHYVRERLIPIYNDEKKQQEEDDRFALYKKKLDLEYAELRKQLEREIASEREKMKIDLSYLELFVNASTSATSLKGKKVYVDLTLLEQFRKAVVMKAIDVK